jgi:hypothetical protein
LGQKAFIVILDFKIRDDINMDENPMYFEIVGEIEGIESIALGGRIRDIMRLQKQFGSARWRKLKGFSVVRLESGTLRKAELHWYEAYGIGKKKIKIKRFLD